MDVVCVGWSADLGWMDEWARSDRQLCNDKKSKIIVVEVKSVLCLRRSSGSVVQVEMCDNDSDYSETFGVLYNEKKVNKILFRYCM